MDSATRWLEEPSVGDRSARESTGEATRRPTQGTPSVQTRRVFVFLGALILSGTSACTDPCETLADRLLECARKEPAGDRAAPPDGRKRFVEMCRASDALKAKAKRCAKTEGCGPLTECFKK